MSVSILSGHLDLPAACDEPRYNVAMSRCYSVTMCDIGLSGGIPGGVIVTETRREQGAMNLGALTNTIIMV